jgi:hypothetical protein
MDTKTLITEAKARFAHKSAKHYLKEKFNSKLLIAAQGGLWRADAQTINSLSSYNTKTMILEDTFGNIVEVNRKELLDTLKKLYTSVMKEYLKEFKELEGKK